MPADIDEANATITLSINADPTKRATWTAISTNQITTTYTGTSITPSTNTLDLSADNNNVATYTVKNADGKSKVYTLKVEFFAFKIKLDWQAPSTVTQYNVRVFQLFEQMLLKPFVDIMLTKPSDGVLKYAGYIAPQNVYVLVEAMDANGTIIKALVKTGGDMSSAISLSNKAIQVAFTSFTTFTLIEVPLEILNTPTDLTPYDNDGFLKIDGRIASISSTFYAIYSFNKPSQNNQTYLQSHSRLYFFAYRTAQDPYIGEWRARIWFENVSTPSIKSNVVSPSLASWVLGDINKLDVLSLSFP